MLTREQILSFKGKLRTEVVDVPEWGGEVIVSEISGAARDAFEASLVKGKGKQRQQDLANIRAKLVVRCVVDGDGNRVFSDADAADVGELPAAGLDRVFSVAQRLNGFKDEDIAELEGN
jgi:hypothetical protein